MKVLVTGANGFLGRAFAREFFARGVSVVGVARRSASIAGCAEVVAGRLGEPLERVFDRHHFDAVIHAAWDLSNEAVNAPGTCAWAEQGAAAGTRRQLFIGSLSAVDGARSAYGINKLAAARWFTEHGHPVLSLGLVVGRGGLFGRMLGMLEKLPVLPLIAGGRHRSAIVDLPTAIDAVCALSSDSAAEARVFGVHEVERVPMRALLAAARSELRLRTRFLSVPLPLVRAGVSALAAVGLSLGVTRDNLIGLELADRNETPTDVGRFRAQSLTVAEIVARGLAH